MEVICIQEKAFYALLDRVFDYLESKTEKDVPPKWIDAEEAMSLLQIKSKTTLQKLRDKREIRFSQPYKNHIVYDRESIDEFFERHTIEPD